MKCPHCGKETTDESVRLYPNMIEFVVRAHVFKLDKDQRPVNRPKAIDRDVYDKAEYYISGKLSNARVDLEYCENLRVQVTDVSPRPPKQEGIKLKR